MTAAISSIGAGDLQTLGVNQLVQPRGPRVAATAADARRAGEDFEAMFLSQMLSPIFDQIKTDGPFGGGSGESMYRSFMVDAVSRSMAKAGGIGIADQVQREILKLQEARNDKN